MQDMKFYRCRHCGNIVAMVQASGVPVVCCGEKMEELKPNLVDASHEKHVPVVNRKGQMVTVTVGSVLHPMTQEHSIQWVCLQSHQGWQLKQLAPNQAPEAVFALVEGDEPVAAYAYCNLHGLWSIHA